MISLDSWHCFILTSYNAQILEKLDNWLTECCEPHRYKKINWDDSCYRYLGVFIQDSDTAFLFKLVWEGFNNVQFIEPDDPNGYKRHLIMLYQNKTN